MPKTLLIVDDEPLNLVLLEAVLTPLGHRIVRAGSGQEALAAYARHGADLILLDVNMPGLDGIDVLTHLRAQPGASYVPVILVTALSEREYRLRSLEVGADDFLEKPIDSAILLARVRTLLRLKDALDELARRNAELERLQVEQRELTQFVVHDMKSPLAVLHANVQFGEQHLRPDQTDVAEALADARIAAQRLKAMIDSLLTIARLEQSEQLMRRDRVELPGLFTEAAQDHQREALMRGVTLSAETPEALAVMGDCALLRRVLDNLLDNALRHAPAGGRIRLAARAREDGAAEISVSNTGQPVPPALRERVFDKFVRGSRADLGHAGLGLYFCHRVVEAYGGQISVTETPEWPASFVIVLPPAAKGPTGHGT